MAGSMYFLLMLILGGIILDKKGVRFTGKMATITMVVGTAIKYWAISTHSLDGMQYHWNEGPGCNCCVGLCNIWCGC